MLSPKKWSGKSIAMPGVYADVPIQFYHSAKACVEPSVSSGVLRTLRTKSPKHAWAVNPLNPNRVETDESEALILGRAAHHLLFSQENFKKQFAVRPATLGGEKWNGNRTACKVWLEDRAEEGRAVITEAQLERITGIAAALADDPAVKAGCLNGNIEHSYFAKDQKTGLWIKTRPDANPAADLSFVDLKLTRSTDERSLLNTMRDYGYYQQAALQAVMCEMLGFDMSTFTFSFLFVESSEPYDIEFVMVKDDEIVRAKRENRAAIDTFAHCLKTKHWPGRRGDRAEPRWIERPQFQKDEVDARLREEGR